MGKGPELGMPMAMEVLGVSDLWVYLPDQLKCSPYRCSSRSHQSASP